MRWEHWLYTVPLRLQSIFRRRRVEQDLDDEIGFHLARQVAEERARGRAPQQAQDAAQRAFYGVEQRKEQCRDARRVGIVDEVRRNLRFASRRLRRTPGLTAAAVLTLGLGIGATTAVFTALNALILRPLPVAAADRLVSLSRGAAANFSYPDYRDYRDRNDVLTGLAAHRVVPLNLGTGSAESVRIWGYEATGNYFDLLGVKPLLGRLLRPEDDDRPGAHPVVVLSYHCWQRRFAGDPHIVNRTVTINGMVYTVLGVTPPSFKGTELILSPDVWVPMSMQVQLEPDNRWLESRTATNVWMIGRLKDGVSRAQAEASLNRVAEAIGREHPTAGGRTTIGLGTPGLIGKALRGPIAAFVSVLLGVAVLVLLLACFNLAGILVASAAERRKEVAVRLALGASRPQIVRQLLTESLLLACAGGLLGLLVALAVSVRLSAWQPPFDLPINTTLAIDAYVVIVALVTSCVAALVFGLVPALQTTGVALVPALKSAALVERMRRWHVRDVLVTAQIGLSVTLLVASLLVLRSVQHVGRLDLGFVPDRAVSVSFDLGLQGYTEARGRALHQQVLDRVSALPGVTLAGLTNNLPLRIGTNGDDVSIDGRPTPTDGGSWVIGYAVSAGYFEAAGTRLLRGRAIDTRDRSGMPAVAVVNETFVRRFLKGAVPIGSRFRLGRPAAGESIEIVGVVQDGKYQSLGEDPMPVVYAAIAQSYSAWTTLLARTAGPPERVLHAVRGAVLDIDPALTLFNVGTLGDQLAFALFPVHVAASVLSVFGVLAIVLSSTGVFALVAHAVSRRRREIGIRMALGAGASQVLRLVFRRTCALCALGSAAGLSIAAIGSRVMSAVLYGVRPTDPVAYGAGLALMGIVVLAACWYPAHCAVRVDPANTVRQE